MESSPSRLVGWGDGRQGMQLPRALLAMARIEVDVIILPPSLSRSF
jgi:hypothetical protein